VRKIYFVAKVPDFHILFDQGKRNNESFGIHFVNSYSLTCMAIGIIPDRDLNNNFHLIDGRPLKKYLELKLRRKLFQNRGVDFLRNNIGELAKQNVTQIFLSFDSSAEKSLRLFCLKQKINSSNMRFETLDDRLTNSSIPYLSNSQFPERSVVWIFAGTPKQDEIANFLHRQTGLVTVGVGGALDMLMGRKSEAPKYMTKLYLEWFYRLIQEPKRLWKRYTLGNLFFLFLIIYDLFSSVFRLNFASAQSEISLSLPHK